MTTDSVLRRVQAKGWRTGFANLLSRENRAWWRTHRWWVQAILWAVIVNGLVAFVLFAMPAILQRNAGAAEVTGYVAVVQGVGALFQLGTLALGVGAIVLAHDQILGEPLAGVTAWILSKPASRVAYVLAKLAADTMGMLLILVALQSAIGYGLISLANGAPYPVGRFLIGVAGLAVHTLFYLALTLMMGVLAGSRGQVLGVTLGSLLLGIFADRLLGTYSLLTPWSMTSAMSAAALGMTLSRPVWVPLAVTASLALVCVAVALWRFDRIEF